MSMASTSSLVDGPGLYSEDRLCSQLDDEDDVVTMGSLTKTQRKHIRNKLKVNRSRKNLMHGIFVPSLNLCS